MGRTVIVGDVHGCRAELEALLDHIGFTAGDRLVFVGDLVARGPDSLGVLDVARRTGALIVRGNHEQKLLEWREARDAWMHGNRTRIEAPLGRVHREVARALRPVDWTLLATAPLSLELPDHGVRIVHAGLLPGVPFEMQSPETLLHIRTVPNTQRKGRVLWGARYAGPPQVVFGHNAAPGLQLHPWATGLDTGCVYGGALTAIVLQAGQRIPRAIAARRALLVSLPARRVYFDPEERKARVA
jgi:hypothetical protein